MSWAGTAAGTHRKFDAAQKKETATENDDENGENTEQGAIFVANGNFHSKNIFD